MTRSELRDWVRMMVPSAASNRVDDSLMNTMLNKAVRDVNTVGRILISDATFAAVTGQGEYVLPDLIPDFVMIGDSGIYFNNGTDAVINWRELWGVNRQYLNEWYDNWLNIETGQPLYAVIENEKAIIYAPPSQDLAFGFRCPDYVAKPVDMTDDDHYPFVGDTDEAPLFEPLDDAIIDYCRWALAPAVGKDQQGIITRKEYQETVRKQTRLVKARPDYKNSYRFRRKSRLGRR